MLSLERAQSVGSLARNVRSMELEREFVREPVTVEGEEYAAAFADAALSSGRITYGRWMYLRGCIDRIAVEHA